jgi:hypothetical protein
MQQHIRIAMPNQKVIVRHIDATNPQRPAGGGAVRVFAEADA